MKQSAVEQEGFHRFQTAEWELLSSDAFRLRGVEETCGDVGRRGETWGDVDASVKSRVASMNDGVFMMKMMMCVSSQSGVVGVIE